MIPSLLAMTIRIAVVQFEITPLDRIRNFARIETFLQEAKSQRAEVVVFPEDCVTGSIFGDHSRLDATGFVRTMFQALAKKYELDIVTGSCMEGTTEGNFNTSYYINSYGVVLGRYCKNHLYPSEHKFLKPGTEAPVFRTKWGKAALVICWDLRFSELFERLRLQGVELIYCPSYWYHEITETGARYNAFAESDQVDALCVARALETNSVVIYANAAGVMKNPDGSIDTLIGHSQVAMPFYGSLKRVTSNTEEMFTQDVEMDILKESAGVYKI